MSKLKKRKVKSKRIFILGIVFSIVFIAIVSRLSYVMIANGSDYKQLALNQWTKTIKMAPKRGTILSKNGSELALSTDV